MPFEDIAQFVAPGFELPYGSRTYFVPAPNARDGLWLQALLDGAQSMVLVRNIGAANRKVLVGDEQERSAYQLALGSAYDDMLEAGLTWPVLKHAGMTAWLYWCRDPEAAERYWASLKDGRGNDPDPEAESSTPPKPQPGGSPTETPTPTAA